GDAGGIETGPGPAHLTRVEVEQHRRHRRRGRRVADAHLTQRNRGETARGKLSGQPCAGKQRLERGVPCHGGPPGCVLPSPAPTRRSRTAVSETGTRRPASTTTSSAPACLARTQTAAPPAAKFSTICLVTSPGEALTPSSATP